MRGIVWCIWLVAIGLPLALLGLAVDVDRITLAGTAMVAAVVVGWPVLLLAGAVPGGRRRGRTDR